jgi:uncharacterized protein YgbK (DUF1537 family)
LLGRIVRGLHQRGLRRFVVAGGETSGAVVAALGLGAARALVEDGLGPGVCISQGSDPVWLFLKSGKLGSEDVLLRAIQRGEGTGP